MKKSLCLPLLLLTIFYSTVNANICIQVQQSAVNQEGECKTFSTPCDVPEDWRHVPSCDIIKDKDTGTDLEKRMNKRRILLRRNRFKRAKKLEKNSDEDAAKKRIRKKRTFRSNRNRRYTSERPVKNGKRRTFTRKNYSAAARNRVKYLNRHIHGGLEHEGDTTSTERKARRQKTHKIMSNVSKRRTGKLSNKPKWTTQVKYRKTAGAGLRRWQNYHDSEKRREYRQARKKRVYEGIKLKKIWKGDRIEGDF